MTPSTTNRRGHGVAQQLGLWLTALTVGASAGSALAQTSAPAFSALMREALPPAASDQHSKTSMAVRHIQAMELDAAHKAINEALQLDARSSYLHFLNGFVYHLQAVQGDTQKNELAIEGYQQALRLDPGNWIAQEFLGLAYMDNKNFEPAREQFSSVLLMAPASTVAQHGMMTASYLLGDAVTACAMADQVRRPGAVLTSAFLRSAVAVYASCGKFEQAEQMLANWRGRNDGAAGLQRADLRLTQWKSFYQHAGLGSAGTPPPVPPSVHSSTDGAPARPTPAAAPPVVPAKPTGPEETPRMVLVDMVILSTQEMLDTSKGINLFNALSLQLGSATAPAFSRVVAPSVVEGTVGAVSTAITRTVTIPALTYSLNIANANDSMNEILARPTLAAISGQPSEFFSGTNLSAGVVSISSQGGTTVVPVDKRFGIKLAITPTFLANDMIKLKVDAQRTALNASPETPKLAYQINISETSTNANVVMQLGETLVLSGLSEKTMASTRDGVPVLQDIPLLQYLFSQSKTNRVQRSVLLLITPRKPIYTSRLSTGADGTVTDSMKAWRARVGLTASTAPNVELILGRLQAPELFREFRQGDVQMERWDRAHTTGERLREALDYLYY